MHTYYFEWTHPDGSESASTVAGSYGEIARWHKSMKAAGVVFTRTVKEH